LDWQQCQFTQDIRQALAAGRRRRNIAEDNEQSELAILAWIA